MAHRLYFAYGSNLDFDQMEFRCPGARYLGVATLPGHRLRMDTAGFATVVPDPAYEVQGALWSLDGADESKMDYYEGVDFGFYEKRYVTVWYDGDLRDGKDEGFQFREHGGSIQRRPDERTRRDARPFDALARCALEAVRRDTAGGFAAARPGCRLCCADQGAVLQR